MSSATRPADQTEGPRSGVFFRDAVISGPIQRVRAEEEGEEAAGDDLARYEFSVSSESEVRMFGRFFEILDHGDGAVRMDWLRTGNAPLLWMHDRDDQRGRIEAARVEGKRIIVRAAVSPNEEALIRDLDAGIIRNVSIGYSIHSEVLESREEDAEGNSTKLVYRVLDWEPHEVSFVSIPADKSVGIGRAANEEDVKRRVRSWEEAAAKPAKPEESDSPTNQKRTMETATEPKQEAQKPVITIDEARQQATDQLSAERERVAGIQDVANKCRSAGLGDFSEEAQKAIAEGDSVTDFSRACLGSPKTGGQAVVHTGELGLTEREQRSYSLGNVIQHMNEQAKGVRSEVAAFEMEVSEAVKTRMGHDSGRAGAIAIPHDMLLRGYRPKGQRDLASVTLSGAGQHDTGAELVPEEHLAERFVEALQEDSVLLGLVTVIPGLVGDVDIPGELLLPTFDWIAEHADATETSFTLRSILLRFKTLSGEVPWTRRLDKQSIPSYETLVSRAIRRGLARAMDAAMINGAGSATVPQGMLTLAGIGDVVLGTPGTLTYDESVQFYTTLRGADANGFAGHWIANSAEMLDLLTTRIESGDATLAAQVVGENISYIGRPALITNQCPAGSLLYAVLEFYLLGLWGAPEMMLDTTTLASKGGKIMRVFQDADGQPAHAGAIAACTNI